MLPFSFFFFVNSPPPPLTGLLLSVSITAAVRHYTLDTFIINFESPIKPPHDGTANQGTATTCYASAIESSDGHCTL